VFVCIQRIIIENQSFQIGMYIITKVCSFLFFRFASIRSSSPQSDDNMHDDPVALPLVVSSVFLQLLVPVLKRTHTSQVYIVQNYKLTEALGSFFISCKPARWLRMLLRSVLSFSFFGSSPAAKA